MTNQYTNPMPPVMPQGAPVQAASPFEQAMNQYAQPQPQVPGMTPPVMAQPPVMQQPAAPVANVGFGGPLQEGNPTPQGIAVEPMTPVMPTAAPVMEQSAPVENQPVQEVAQNAPAMPPIMAAPEAVAPVIETPKVEEVIEEPVVEEVIEPTPQPVVEEAVEEVVEAIAEQATPVEEATPEEVVVATVANPASFGKRYKKHLEKANKKLLDDETVLFVDTVKLLEAIAHIRRVPNAKSTMTAHGLIYISLKDGKLEFQAFNEDTSIRKSMVNDSEGNVFAATSEFFEICAFASDFVPAIQSIKSLKNLPKEIALKFNKTKIELNFGNRKAHLGLYEDVSDFTLFKGVDDESYVKMTGDYLKSMVSAVGYAAATNNSRPIVCGINIKIQQKDNETRIQAVATDSHRVARTILDLESSSGTIECDVTVPTKSLSEVASLVNNDEIITLKLNENGVEFGFGDISIYTRTFEGNYPDVSRLIPTLDQGTTSIDVRVSKIRDSLNYATAFVNSERNKNITLYAVPDKKQIRLHGKDSEAKQEVQEDFFAEESSGGNLRISFNIQFMKDSLKKYNDEDVITFSFSGEQKPFVFFLKAGSIEDVDLILPIRIPEEKAFDGKLKGFIKQEQSNVFDYNFDDFN